MSTTAPPPSHGSSIPPAATAQRRWTTWLLRGTAVLVVLVLLVAGATWGGWWWVRQATPLVDGSLTVGPEGGLLRPARIQRDTHGIPSIEADSIEDAMFALGVVHAQDRRWQMEVHRRIGAGRLAEAFGPAAVGNDRFLRALGVRRAAEAQWANVGEESRRLLLAYAAGVNFVTDQLPVLPPEFLLTGIRPEPWTPVDSLSWTLMMAWDLGGNWTTELQRLRLASHLPTDRILQVLPVSAGSQPTTLRDFSVLYQSLGLASTEPSAHARTTVPDASPWETLLAMAPPSGIEGAGSNNWVLAPERSATGGPLLANDPHLGLSTPALWYIARIKAPGLEVAGATLPGVPLVVLGQNRDLAWGFTNTGPDVQDLYLEAIDPEDPSRYRTPSGTAAFDVREERIEVKGASAITLRLRTTRHGPVVSDAATWADLEPSLNASRHVLALRWTALEPDTDMVAAGLALARAQTTEGFIRASRLWLAPMQNMVVADRRGTIALVAAGRVPMRRSDNDLWGMAPAPGWESRYDWAGWVPYDETPRLINPPIGFIATANQRVHEPGYPHFLGTEWALPYRQQRIEQLLDGRARHSLDDLRAVQQDELSLAARALLPWFRRATTQHPLGEALRPALQPFDGRMNGEATAPLVYWAWHRALSQRLLSHRLGPPRYERLIAQRSFQETLERILTDNDSYWCDDLRTSAAETCQTQIDAALTDALTELTDRLGPSVSTWQWSRVHQAVGEHRPFSRVAPLQHWFETRTHIGGDTFTVHALRVSLGGKPTDRYAAHHGPSLKALYDVKNPAASRMVHSTGQSGLPWSPHYRDFTERWKAGDTIPLWASHGETPAATLRLEP